LAKERLIKEAFRPQWRLVLSAFLNTSLGKWTGIVIAVLTGSFAQTMMKLGVRRLGAFGETPFFVYLFKLLTAPLVMLAIASYGFGVIFYMFMLSRLNLSYLYPVMTALGLILTTVISATLLGEHVSPLRLGGIVLMVLGVFAVSRS
jgi:multidrug transporter EmrE-like cation transporter